MKHLDEEGGKKEGAGRKEELIMKEERQKE